MNPTQWADLAALRFSRFGPVGKLMDEMDWQPWAADLCSLPSLRNQAPPDPYQFDQFEAWATTFDQIITIGD